MIPKNADVNANWHAPHRPQISSLSHYRYQTVFQYPLAHQSLSSHAWLLNLSSHLSRHSATAANLASFSIWWLSALSPWRWTPAPAGVRPARANCSLWNSSHQPPRRIALKSRLCRYKSPQVCICPHFHRDHRTQASSWLRPADLNNRKSRPKKSSRSPPEHTPRISAWKESRRHSSLALCVRGRKEKMWDRCLTERDGWI